jgi:hypothetical protein
MVHKIETQEELKQRCEALKNEADRLIAISYAGMKDLCPTHQVEYTQKWAKIWTVNRNNQKSIYAFVSMTNGNTNKTLGEVFRGDIHLPASWRAPAKHSRGNVAQDDFGGLLGPHGPNYLRQ